LAPSLVCTLTTETVERMIDGNPRVTLEMLRLLSKRLRAAEIRLTEPVYKPGYCPPSQPHTQAQRERGHHGLEWRQDRPPTTPTGN
jgi:CRP-like cAMP-binding protein